MHELYKLMQSNNENDYFGLEDYKAPKLCARSKTMVSNEHVLSLFVLHVCKMMTLSGMIVIRN